MGFALAPMENGEVVKPVDFNARPADERRGIKETIEAPVKDLPEVVSKMPQTETRRREQIRAMNIEMAAPTSISAPYPARNSTVSPAQSAA